MKFSAYIICALSIFVVSYGFDNACTKKVFKQSKKVVSGAFLALSINSVVGIPNVQAVDKPAAPLYGLVKNRLLKCDTKSNCISTSAINSIDHYGRPWSFESVENDPEKAWKLLVDAVKNQQYINVVEIDNEKHYIRAEAKSVVPPSSMDDIEFLMPSPMSDKLVTYRSNSREKLFAPGLSGPVLVGDGGSHRNRLESIRNRLSLNEMGTTIEQESYFKQQNDINFIKKIRMASEPSAINFEDNSVPDQVKE